MTKREVQELATRQSRLALNVTRGLRAHGWREKWDRETKKGVPTTEADRTRWAQSALDAAREVERTARGVRYAVEDWARNEGAV